MVEIHERYIVDGAGHKKAVVVDFKEWKAIIEILEGIDDIRFYDNAKMKEEDILLFEDAVKEIEEGLV